MNIMLHPPLTRGNPFLPIGIQAAWMYYKEGYVDSKIAALVAAGFMAGSLVVAMLRHSLTDEGPLH